MVEPFGVDRKRADVPAPASDASPSTELIMSMTQDIMPPLHSVACVLHHSLRCRLVKPASMDVRPGGGMSSIT